MAWRGETEDGLGWGGLVPTAAERAQEKREQRTARRLEVAQRMADALRNLLLKDIDGLPPFEADARAALAEWEATR